MRGGSARTDFFTFSTRPVLIRSGVPVDLHVAVRRSAMVSYTMIVRPSCVIQITPLNSERAFVLLNIGEVFGLVSI